MANSNRLDPPAGFHFEDEPTEEYESPVGFTFEDEPTVAPESIAAKTQEPELPDGFHFEEEPGDASKDEEIGYFSNLARGAGESATDLAGSFIKSVQLLDKVVGAYNPVADSVIGNVQKLSDATRNLGEKIEKHIPLGGLSWEDGDILPSYKSPKEWAAMKRNAPDVYASVSRLSKALKDVDMGYKERATWDNIVNSFSEGGVFSGGAYADVLLYGVELGAKSAPHMIAMSTALPAYIVGFAGQIGEENAKLEGKPEVEAIDVLQALPFSAGSAFADRFGLKGMTTDVIENLGKDLMKSGLKNAVKRVAKEGGKATVREGVTEAIQEGMIEYVGERYGTDVALDFNEALNRGGRALVGGAVMGGVMGTSTATAVETMRPFRPQTTAAPQDAELSLEQDAGGITSEEVIEDVVDIGQTASTDEAVNAANDVINRELELHRKKMAQQAELDKQVQPKIQEEMESLITEPVLTPEQIKTQELLNFEEAQQYAEFKKPETTEPAGATSVPEQGQSETSGAYATEAEMVGQRTTEAGMAEPLTKEARIKQQAEARRTEKARPTESLVSDLTLSEEVPQIKSGANKQGVVEPLGGTYDPVGTGPIQVWVRKDGSQEVISGRHRLDLAKRSGTKAVAVQKHYEDEGFTAKDAKSLDALLNIREGQGKVKDYVDFIKSNDISVPQAETQGILARNIGKQAFTIATYGSDLLVDAHAQERISDNAATKIASAAPNSEALQAVGIKALADGKPINIAENMVKAVSTVAGSQQQTQSGDLFGFDDTALIEAEDLANAASNKQAAIQRTLSAIQGAAKDPKRAAKEGVDVRDPAAVQRRIDELKQQKFEWSRWHSNPEMVAELRNEIGASVVAEQTAIKEESEGLKGLVEAAPVVAERVTETVEVPRVSEPAAVEVAEPDISAVKSAPDERTEANRAINARFESYRSTLKDVTKANRADYGTFLTDMKTKFDEAVKKLPEGTITNQKDFTQFIQAQTGAVTPLAEIKLTRKVTGKHGKVQVVQADAETVLRQTRKKRDLATKLLRCIYG